MSVNVLPIRNQGSLFNSQLAYQVLMSVVALVVLVSLIILKSRTAAQFWSDPLLLAYTFFITTFQMSRLVSALLYRYSFSQLVPRSDLPNTLNLQRYEPTVSFVIPCKNEEAAIEKTVTKCFEADYPAHKLEVIVINDGSTDGTGAVLAEMQKKYPQLIVITFEKNQGKRHGMAVGYRRAKGEIIVQLDSDSYIRPELFRHLITPFENPRIAAVCAHTDPENSDENILTKMQAAYYFLSFRIMKAAESTYGVVFCCSGCSSAYRRAVVVPMLDEFLAEKFLGLPVTWGDDRALTNLILRQGLKTIYTDEAKAYTIVPTKFKQLITQQIRWKKGWFVNSIGASKFIFKLQPFVTLTYFWPLIILTLLTPFMAVRALLYNSLWLGNFPLYYFFGIFLVTSLYLVIYRMMDRSNKYWAYYYLWSLVNTVFFCLLLPYALLTIQNRKWGTR